MWPLNLLSTIWTLDGHNGLLHCDSSSPLSIVPAPENTVIIRENIPAQPGAPSQVNSGIKDKQQEQRGEIK